MDFGDILNKWENQKGKGVREFNSWIQANGIYDKDSETEEPQISAQETRRRLKNKRPDAELDIHGMTHDEAWLALEVFFNESKRKSLEKILVIHGKGNHSAGEAVLKRTVMDFIERCPCAGESGRGKAAAGGEGVTWVLIK